jgi:HAD superfamily hydrolase (TIGR01509 family)
LVDEMLAQVRCAVASNTSEPHWSFERSRLPFGTRLQPEVVSYRVGAMKPDALFFEALCDMSGVAPERIVFTDDREDNVAGAARLGITALLYRGHEQLRRDLRSLGFSV